MPPSAVDTGYAVRLGRPNDAEALARAFLASWMEAYREIVPGSALRRSQSLPGVLAEMHNLLGGRSRLECRVLTGAHDKPVGFVTYGATLRRPWNDGVVSPIRLADEAVAPYAGQIYELYVDPDHQGHGGGSLLLHAALERLSALRLLPPMVWALADNERARGFYEARGGRMFAAAPTEVGGYALTMVAYGWPTMRRKVAVLPSG